MQKTKMAAMGEMIDAIGHQWKQPISTISLTTQMLSTQMSRFDEFKNNSHMKSIVDEYKENTLGQIKHLISTIEEFRKFFRPLDENKSFSISEAIEGVISLLKTEINQNKIVITKDLEEGAFLLGSENEFKHILINLINNTKDAYLEKGIKEKPIDIKLYKNDNKNIVLEFSDKAGGIPNHIIGNIFKANVSSKESKGGTGIGLYLCSQIANKFGATLSVENTNEGAKFTFFK